MLMETEFVLEEALVDLLAHPETAMELYNDDGVQESMLLKDEKHGQRLMRFVFDFIDEHRVAPEFVIVQDEFPEIDFERPVHPVGYVVDRLKQRWARNEVNEVLKSVARLAREDPIEAAEIGFKEMGRIQNKVSASFGINPIEDWELRLSEYNKAVLEGERSGYTLGFEDIDEALNGVIGLVFVAGRPGRFKSWVTLNSAHKAALAGAKVVYFTLELPVEEMSERWECLATNTSFNRRMKGKWTTDDYKKYNERMPKVEKALLASGGEIHILHPPVARRTVTGLREIAERYDADVVYIDQFSFLKHSGRTEKRWEAAEYLCEDLKIWANETPLCIACQLNRTAGSSKDEKINLDTVSVAISDAIPQKADLLLGLDQSKDQRATGTFKIEVIKARSYAATGWIMGVDFFNGCLIDLVREIEDE